MHNCMKSLFISDKQPEINELKSFKNFEAPVIASSYEIIDMSKELDQTSDSRD